MRKLKLLFTLCLLLGAVGAKAQFDNEIPLQGCLSVSSNHSDGANNASPENLFDGNAVTFWHSNYGGGTGQKGMPQWILVELPANETITGFGMQKRQGNNFGPKEYKIYVSETDFGLTAPATTVTQRDAVNNISESFLAGNGTFNNTNDLLNVELTTPKKGKYILFVITAPQSTADYTCIAEFKLYTVDASTRLQNKVNEYQSVFELIPSGTQFGCAPETAHLRVERALSAANAALTGTDENAVVAAIDELDEAMAALKNARVGEGEIYLIKCVGESYFASYDASKVKNDNVILAAKNDYTLNTFFNLEIAEVVGEQIYYYIRSVVDPSQYVYAINTGDENSNVGVAQAQVDNAILEKAKWKFVDNTEGWNIIPKNGSNSWNVRGPNDGGKEHIGQWYVNSNRNNMWTIQTAEEYIITNKLAAYEGSNGEIGGINYAEKMAQAQTLASNLTNDFTDANLTAYKNFTVVPITPASGLYKISNKHYGLHLYSEQTSNNEKNVTLGKKLQENAKYYWNVEFTGNQATIVGSTGLSMAKGQQNALYNNVNKIDVSPVTLQFAPGDDANWTENCFVFANAHTSTSSTYTKLNKNYDENTNPIFLTHYGSTGGGNQYTFEPVTLAAGKAVYTVEISGAAPANAMVTYTVAGYDGNAEVYDDGFYVLTAAEAVPGNFTATTMEGRTYTLKVDGNYIRVNYSIAETGAKLYSPGARATTTTLATGKKYFIYNTCSPAGQNRSGFMWNNGSDKVQIKQVWPSTVKTLSEAYLFVLENATREGEDGKYYIKSLLNGKYVDINGNPTNESPVALSIIDFMNSGHKPDPIPLSYKEDEETVTDAIEASDNVWAIESGSDCWHGNVGSFVKWSTSHPFAFYEATETDYNGEIAESQTLLNEVLSSDGAGYPLQSARNTLNDAILSAFLGAQNSTVLSTAYTTAITAYKKSSAINMPEEGKAYKIVAVYISGKEQPLYYDATAGRIAAKNQEYITDGSDKFICRVVNGKYVFVNEKHGKYMLWCDSGEEGENTKSYSAKGFSDSYLPHNAWEVGAGVVKRDNEDTFGKVYLRGLDRTQAGSYYLAARYEGDNTAAHFISSGYNAWWYDEAETDNGGKVRTPLYRLEEVEYTPLTTDVKAVAPLDETHYMGTFSSTTFPLEVPEGVKAYAVDVTDAANNSAATTEIGEVIPANTGVLLVAESETTISGVKILPALKSVTYKGDNLLVGTGAEAVTVEANEYNYVLSNPSAGNGLGFYRLAGDREVPAFRAYLRVPATEAGVKSFHFNFGELTGIENVETETPAVKNEKIYDLSGRVVRTPQRGGLYIKGGKKFIQK